MDEKKATMPEDVFPKKRKKKKKKKIISKELSSETKFKNTEKNINISSDNKDNNNIVMYKTGTKDSEKSSIIKRLKINKCCTYFCCICESKRKTIENVLLKEGINLFTEKMDILRLFKKILNDEKINFEVYNISDEGMFKIYKKRNLNID